MLSFTVTLRNGQVYRFLAEDADHAREQAENAEPDNPVVSVSVGLTDLDLLDRAARMSDYADDLRATSSAYITASRAPGLRKDAARYLASEGDRLHTEAVIWHDRAEELVERASAQDLN